VRYSPSDEKIGEVWRKIGLFAPKREQPKQLSSLPDARAQIKSQPKASHLVKVRGFLVKCGTMILPKAVLKNPTQ
jgi:hypothetical protein